MDIKPLQCFSCGNAVPLSDGQSTTCTSCGTKVPIPSEYQEWRLQKQEKLEAEERLIHLHEKLGKTPKRWEVWLSKIKGGCGCSGCFLFLVAMQIGKFILQASMGVLSFLPTLGHQEANPDAELSLTVILLFLSPYLVGTIIVLATLTYVRRKVLTLATLQGKMVASPPVHPGGPSTCRSCGSPLEIKPGQICSPCFYCGSQNLVALDPQWCQQLQGHTQQSQTTFAEAMRVYRDTNRGAAKKIVRNTIIFLLFGWLIVSSSKSSNQKRWPPLGFQEFQARQAVLGIDPSIPELQLYTPISFDFHATDQRRGGELQNFDAAYFFVPLDKGEKLNINLSTASEPAKIAITALNDNKRLLERRIRNWKTLSGKLQSHTAEKRSWHCVSISPMQKTESASYTVEFIIEGREPRKVQELPANVGIDSLVLNMKPTEELESLGDSGWKAFGQAKIQLDSQNRIKRIRGFNLDGGLEPPVPGRSLKEAWLETYGGGKISQVLREQNYRQEYVFERLYHGRQTVLKIVDSHKGFVEFEISRGKLNDGKTVPEVKPSRGPKVQSEAPAATISFQDFLFDQKAQLWIRGIKPGTDRKTAEDILGPPKRQWGRYANYGNETVCYWNGKVRWIRSNVLSQGGRAVNFQGPYDFQSKSFGKELLRTQVSGQPRNLNSFMCDGHFFRMGPNLIGIYTYNSEILSAALLSDDIFPKATKLEVKTTAGAIKAGPLHIQQGDNDLDKLYGFLGQEHLHFLLTNSTETRLLPEELTHDEDARSFQFELWARYPRARLEFWKREFYKVGY